MADDTATAPAPEIIEGRYELGPVIGRGGTADVYRALDLRLRREVAVKLFPRGIAGPDKQRQEFELATLARLRHPGLIILFDAGTHDDRVYLVMQLVSGPPLAERLTTGPLPQRAVVGLGAQLADTLAYVHSQGITHRDVKPANVLLGEDDRPMLGDFGIARLVDTTRVTAAGYLVGTAAYMSPEQVQGAPVGPATDVYALGLLLLECVTGRREYPGAMMETLTARLHRPPAVPPGLIHGLTPLLTAMTTLEAVDRPTAAEVTAALRSPGGGTATMPVPQLDDATTRLAATTRVQAAPPVAVPPAPTPARRTARAAPAGSAGSSRRLLPVLVGVLLAAVGAAFLWSLLSSGEDPAPAPPRPSPIAPITPSPTTEEPTTTEPEPEPTFTEEPEPAPPPPSATPAPTPTPEPEPTPTTQSETRRTSTTTITIPGPEPEGPSPPGREPSSQLQ